MASFRNFLFSTSAIAVLMAGLLSFTFASYDIDEDTKLDSVGLLTKYGYPAEAHDVTTEDGYVLTLHRVPSSPRAPPLPAGGARKRVVFLQHGLLLSSADWVVMGPGRGLAYILADAGYDVWMGNVRGNTYSRRHIKYNPDGLFNSKFWNFEWHEIGIFDLSASIDYVLNRTGEDKVFYLGHSMGNIAFYVLNSMRPEYNAKFRAMFALAPSIYLGNFPHLLLRGISFFNKPIEYLTDLLGVKEFLPSNELTKTLARTMCRDNVSTQFLCKNLVLLLAGYNPEELNSTMLPVIWSHFPAGSSWKSVVHMGQVISSGEFQQWDYGVTNSYHYKSLTPPKYNVSQVTVPVALHYSEGDWLNPEQGVERLYKEARNLIGKFKVPDKKFSHLDYLWGIHAKELVYDLVLNLMKRY